MLNRVYKLAIIAAMGIVGALPAAAQNAKMRIDSANSTARLVVASSEDPSKTINVGVARVSGDVRWNAANPTKSAFDFTAYPADQSHPGQTSAETADYTVISFRSKRVEPVGYGAVRVTGELTVSEVERVASYGPDEGYSGPTYGPSVVHSANREVAFIFQPAKETGTSDEQAPLNWVASSTVVGEDFPELLDALSASDWPAYVAEENCVMPPGIGEDFSGPTCTGRTVETLPRTDLRCATPLTIGEDFGGQVCTGTPLELASNASAQNTLHTQKQTGNGAHKLTANEVKIRIAVQLARREAARVGSTGE